VAVVFGSETFGLSNEQLMKCRWLINIPANPDYMSLNLAAAVQVWPMNCAATLEDAGAALPQPLLRRAMRTSRPFIRHWKSR
jgi:tRNA/rRNA methyltransferase